MQKRRRYKVGDPDFQAPDGGWGWLIVFACGFSNLSIYPMYQQFGLVFRERFSELGITGAETTTVINMNSAFGAFVGLLNGPIFRQFTFRQVGLFGSLLVAASVFFLQYASSFTTYMILYALCYGVGLGITQASSSLALNTYFKEKRRIATGLTWSTTSFGAVIWPYILTATLDNYGVQGTLTLFSAFALHAFMSALLLQPVEWHTKFREEPEASNLLLEQTTSSYNVTSSRNLYNEDDLENTGYEIVDLAIPRMAKANDGYFSQFGSRTSISSYKTNKCTDFKNSFSSINSPGAKRPIETNPITEVEEIESINEDRLKKLSFWSKIALFFDLDLLKDLTYVNLLFGITLANFAELNFTMLTPIILNEFNYEKYETATFMSLLGAVDISGRLIVPFVAGGIGWDNKTFFLFGIMLLAFGRIVLAHCRNYYIALMVAVLMGIGKGFRTIFMNLIIPSHVALERLPAASGLQLAISGLFFVTVGPLVGLIRDYFQSYAVTLHILNICTYLTILSWSVQSFMVASEKNKDTLDQQSVKC